MRLIRPVYNLLLKFRFLFRPMFFISLIFHIGFLSLPLPSSSNLQEEKTEEIEDKNDLEVMEEYIDTLPIQFIREEHQPFFLTEEQQLKSETLGFLTIPQTSPYGAYFDYIEPVVKNELGFEINQLEEQYGDSLLYEAKNSSDITFYMSIIKLKGSGALLVLWVNNPQIYQANE